ncbi:MAG TPA: exopolysaccharide biosynthesis polyprenyl glycosylphosphotransferase [Thermoleophilaceae bacterium]
MTDASTAYDQPIVTHLPLAPSERPSQRWGARRRAQRALGQPIPEGDSGAIARRDAAYRLGLFTADMLATAFAVVITVAVIGNLGFEPAALGALLLVPLLAKAIGLYDRDEHLIRKTTLDEIPQIFQASTLFTLFLWIGDYQFFDNALNHKQIVVLWLLLFLSMAIARTVARRVVRTIARPERCLIIGDVESAEPVRRKLRTNHTLNAVLIGRVPLEDDPPLPDVVGSFDNLGIVLAEHDIDRVLIAPGGQDPELILHAIRMVKSMGVKVSVLPRLFEVVGSAVEFDDLDGIPLLGLRGQGLPRSSRLLKRICDVAAASLALLILGPAMLIIAIAIRLDSPGTVFFRQKRVGRHGQAFEIFKFRTMFEGADSMKNQLLSRNEGADGFFKIADDPRVTRVGRLLRKTYLDELPQLINVLRGEMSLVGPRPLVMDEDRRINGWQRGRLDLTPGMTGFWQVLGSSRVPLHEMVKIDYLYATNWSLWLDLKVILRTVPYVLARRGL